MLCAVLLPPDCRWQEHRSGSTLALRKTGWHRLAHEHLPRWPNELLQGSSSPRAGILVTLSLQETALRLCSKPLICTLWNAEVTFEIKRGLEVQMAVKMNINSRVINNWSCLPDTWLLIKRSEGAQAKPETSQLGAKASARAPVLAGTEDALNVWLEKSESSQLGDRVLLLALRSHWLMGPVHWGGGSKGRTWLCSPLSPQSPERCLACTRCSSKASGWGKERISKWEKGKREEERISDLKARKCKQGNSANRAIANKKQDFFFFGKKTPIRTVPHAANSPKILF